MAFINQAVTVLQTLVIALGAGLAVWGVINLMEGYSVIIGNVYGVCCPVNISTEHFEFSRLRKTESVTL